MDKAIDLPGGNSEPSLLRRLAGFDKTGVWRPSIAAFLSFGFGVFVFFALALVWWVSFDAARDNTNVLTKRVIKTSLQLVQENVEDFLELSENQATYLVYLMESKQLDPDNEKETLKVITGAMAGTPWVSGVALFREKGNVTYAAWQEYAYLSAQQSVPPELLDGGDSEKNHAEMKEVTEPVWQGVSWLEKLKKPNLIVQMPVRIDGKYYGFVGVAIGIEGLSQYIREIDDSLGVESFVLVNRKSLLAHGSMARLDSYELSHEKVLPLLADVQEADVAGFWEREGRDIHGFFEDDNPSGRVVEVDGEEIYYFFSSKQDYGFDRITYAIFHPQDEISDLYERLIYSAVAAGAVMVVTLLALFWIGRSMARPLLRLTENSEKLARFDLEKAERLPGTFFKELNVASQSYNSMLSGLHWFGSYVPKKLVAQIIGAGENGIVSTEKRVSILFTDIVGFTSLSESMSPSEVADMLNEHFNALGQCIEDQEGVIDKYIGDSVMAFWGAPGDQDDHALRACQAALNIASALEAINVQRLERGLPAIRIRIGVNSGTVIAGNIGADWRVNYTLIGDSVNAAQRIEALAKELLPESGDAATIIVSAETAAQIDASKLGGRLRDLGAHRLRGREEQTELYQLQVD